MCKGTGDAEELRSRFYSTPGTEKGNKWITYFLDTKNMGWQNFVSKEKKERF